MNLTLALGGGGEWLDLCHDYFTSGKWTPIPLARRLVGCKNWSGCCGEVKKLCPLQGAKLQLVIDTRAETAFW